MMFSDHGPGTAAAESAPTLALSGAIGAMLLIRLAISIFALSLLGLAVSLNAAQSGQDTRISNTAALTGR
ncbi:MAG TPA: hypothetical protein VEH02_01345 [Pseudolabrys sp.]|nr:hypothetical protein [Pseudolabrys sp.]